MILPSVDSSFLCFLRDNYNTPFKCDELHVVHVTHAYARAHVYTRTQASKHTPTHTLIMYPPCTRNRAAISLVCPFARPGTLICPFLLGVSFALYMYIKLDADVSCK